MRNNGHVFLHALSKHTAQKPLRTPGKFFVVYFVFLSMAAQAQTDSGTAAVYRPAVENAIAEYHRFRGGESNLYNGPARAQSTQSGKGTPYFGAGDWFSGTVAYNGTQYNSVSLLYDLVQDELIVYNPLNRSAFYLFKPRVDSFTLGSKTFVYLKRNGNKSAPAEGYYEQVVKGPITLFQKRTKSYQENLSITNLDQRFDEKTRFYALKDGVYYGVSSAKSLYALMGNDRNKVKEQVKKRPLEPGTDLERTLAAIAQSYNQSSH